MADDAKYAEFSDKGYQIFPGVITSAETQEYKHRLVEVYNSQAESFGLANLRRTQEENMVRSPFLSDPAFEKLFYNDFTENIVNDILGEHAILSLQNGIVVPPQSSHHQAFYHRDIIHQDFVSSVPLAINLYYCLDDYTSANGATTFIPGSHKEEKLTHPDRGAIARACAGSVILFDSMIYHKAGLNQTNQSRAGLNHMFTLPFLKQQINYSLAVAEKPTDPLLARRLGFESREYPSVSALREYRLARTLL